MCDPATLALSAAAAASIGQVASGVSQAQQLRYQGKIADRNAAMAREQARDASERGRMEQQQLGRKYAGLKGQQQTAMAANGLDTSFGSAALTAQDTAMLYGEDADAMAKNTYNEVRGFDISSSNYSAEASAKRRGATGALISAGFGAASTALGGAQQYGKLKRGQ